MSDGVQTQTIDVRVVGGVDAEIKNWSDSVTSPIIRNTSLKTYIIDPAGLAGPKNVQISDYEPKRIRMAIQVIDVAVTLLSDAPVTSPDASSASTAPQGLYMPPNPAAKPYEFFGPDAFFLNALTAVTRVTVVKEYR